VLFLVAVLLYRLYRHLIRQKDYILYHNAFSLLQIFSLLLLYMSVNYLVVRQLSEDLLGLKVVPGDDIPFAWLFYIFTFLIPAAFIVYSLVKRVRIIVYIGVAAFAFSIYTIRYYHSIMPIELALTLGGVLLFAVAYLSMRSIQHKAVGITFMKDRSSKDEAFSLAQALIANSHVGANTPSNAESPMTFGGGGYSGGGAGETF
jgi:uncharacterized membrane protein YgcG